MSVSPLFSLAPGDDSSLARYVVTLGDVRVGEVRVGEGTSLWRAVLRIPPPWSGELDCIGPFPLQGFGRTPEMAVRDACNDAKKTFERCIGAVRVFRDKLFHDDIPF